MKAKIKPISNGKPETLKSRGDFENALTDIVTMQLDKERLEGLRDAKILKATSEFAPDITDLANQMKKKIDLAEQYAADHRDEVLGDKKSGETCFATFGFRAGKPSLVLLNDKWSWDKVVTAIKTTFGDLAAALIVTKEQPDKNAIKSNLSEADLKTIGTKLEADEKFFIEPKRDPADPRRLVSERKAA